MRRSAVESYLNRGPRIPVATFQQTFPTGTSAWDEDLRKRAELNQQADRAVTEAYNSRLTPASGGPAARSAAAPQEEQGRPPAPYSGGPGEAYDPQEGLPGSMDRQPQEYGGPGGGYTSVETTSQTGPARALSGAPQSAEAPPEQSGAFENTDEYTRDMPGVSPPMQFSEEYRPQPVPAGLPAPFDSPDSIIAAFGENPNRTQLNRIIGLQFHQDRTGDPSSFQNVSNAVNNAYGRKIIGSSKPRRKYRY
jgi:hypothetical protein